MREAIKAAWALPTVKAWTGYCELEPFRRYRGDDYETNENLGLGNYPVKTFDELRNIAVNIARQLPGDGTFEVLTVPYSPDKYQVLADMGEEVIPKNHFSFSGS